MEDGDLDAEQAALAMAEQYPESPLPWFSLGRHYLSTGAPAKAAEALRRCVALQPDYAAALFALGEACAAAGLPSEARSAFERCRDAAAAQNHPSLAEEAAERAQALA
ncbi:MAG: tetratricopeptide repeat protein [Myxococcales bacterium]